ncbi:MAG: HEAT repeat domain-containing protein [Opitutaceae bacterium]|nr:HEAT repeat domain-containing protein [Opitutaceae bacterium]
MPIRSFLPRLSILVLCLGLFSMPRLPAAEAPFELRDGDRVVFIGDRLIEGEQEAGWIELMLTTQFPGRSVTFRNLGWNGDTPGGESRASLSLIQAGREPPDEGWRQLVRQIEETKPTVALLGYGMASSFAGEAGLPAFNEQMNRLLDTLERVSPGVRVVLLAPVSHEALGAPWPDPVAHNREIDAYSRALADIASARKLRFVPLQELTRNRAGGRFLTFNGIHPTDTGYHALAGILEESLFGGSARGAWRESSPVMKSLRDTIVRKNDWFFYESRPANYVYIFGFRKREQGRNAAEIAQFPALIAAEEARIAKLRTPGAVPTPDMVGKPTQPEPVKPLQPFPDFTIADNLEVRLWAESPMLHKPVQMNFDEKGRLWIATSELYPQIQPGQDANDKIIVLEDTKGAGRADKSTVFADGLLIPTGIEVGDGGAYVAQSTDLIHFRDTDGDGRADERQTVLSGFGTEDTHHNLHTLRWGVDGRLYMNQSVYTRTNAETPTGVVRLKAGGMFRFDPRNHRMEVAYRGWINAWGHAFDNYGDSFVTDGAGYQGVSWAFPRATFRTLAPARREAKSISLGQYPKFCGAEVIRSPLFSSDWQGDIVTADFRAHRLVRFKYSESGAGFVTQEMPDFVRATADSFRPIDLRIGPDGALYVADWSNPIIQHGEVDFRDPRRDKTNGRIWRIAPKGSKEVARRDLGRLSVSELLDLLTSQSGYDQDQATRQLKDRGVEAVLPALDRWTAARQSDIARLHALRIYQVFDRVPPALIKTLADSADSRVRGAAVRALPADMDIDILAQRVADAHPRVRLEAVVALGARGTARAAELVLSALGRPMDPFLDYAIWQSINELAKPWLEAVKSGTWQIKGHEAQLEFALKAIEPADASQVLGSLIARGVVPFDGSGNWFELIGAAGGQPEIDALYSRIATGALPEPVKLRAMEALLSAVRLRSVIPSIAADSAIAMVGSPSEKIRVAALRLLGAWKSGTSIPTLRALAEKGGADEREAAITALREIGNEGASAALRALAGSGSSPVVRRDAVVALATIDFNPVSRQIVSVLAETRDSSQSEALWRSLLAIKGVGKALPALLATESLPMEVAKAGLRPAREGGRFQELADLLAKAAGLSASSEPLTTARFQELAREAAAKGDPHRGEWLYRRPDLACISCHAIGGAGGHLGPDLTSIGASAPPDYLVESLLAPGAKVKEGYHAISIATKDGQEQMGMVVRETATEVMLRNAANVDVSIPVSQIVRRTNIGSLMPSGLIDTLLPEERLDLYAFLASLGKPGDFDAGKGGVARVWRAYLVSSANEHLGIQRVLAADPALGDWVRIESFVNGTLPVYELEAAFPTRANNRGFFIMTQFDAPQGGNVSFTLSGESAACWLNGKRVTLGKQFSVDAKPGVNSLVLEINPLNLPAIRLSSDTANFVLQ